MRNKLMEEKFYDSTLGYHGKIIYHDLMSLPPVVFNSDQEWIYYSLIQNDIKIDYFPDGCLLVTNMVFLVTLKSCFMVYQTR